MFGGRALALALAPARLVNRNRIRDRRGIDVRRLTFATHRWAIMGPACTLQRAPCPVDAGATTVTGRGQGARGRAQPATAAVSMPACGHRVTLTGVAPCSDPDPLPPSPRSCLSISPRPVDALPRSASHWHSGAHAALSPRRARVAAPAHLFRAPSSPRSDARAGVPVSCAFSPSRVLQIRTTMLFDLPGAFARSDDCHQSVVEPLQIHGDVSTQS